MKKHALSAALAVILIPSAVVAAEDLSTGIEPVIVTATRSELSAVTTPASISVIDREQIAASGASHISQVLAAQAGIQMSDLYGDGSRGTPGMRGFSSSAATLVLVDGRRLNNSDLGGADLNSIPLHDVERVEIIHGSAGSLFGDQAVGGVINIITRAPRAAAAHIEAGAGSFQDRALRGWAMDRLDNGLAWRVSGERRHSDNYRDHNAQDYGSAFVRLDYEGLFAELEQVDETLLLPGALSAAQLAADRTQADPFNPDDRNDSASRIARLGLRQGLGEDWQLEAELTSREGDLEGKLWGSAFTQNRRHLGLTPRLVGSLPGEWGETLVTLGADIEKVDYSFSGAFGSTDDERTMQALYAQALTPVSLDLVATVGLRHARLSDRITDSSAFPAGTTLDEEVSVGELGLSWQVQPDWRVFARRDGNFRFPLVDENTFTSPGVVGLKPQTGVSWELGSEWRGAGWHSRLLAYRLDLDNELAYDASAPGPWGSGANVNLDPTRRTGALLEGSVQLSPALALSGQAAWVDPTMRGGPNDGKAIPFVASQSLRLAADWQFAPAWRLYTEWQHTGERHQDADYANALAKLPAVDVVNLNLGWRDGAWSANARVNNLTDREYAAFATYDAWYPAPTRHVLVTVGYDF